MAKVTRFLLSSALAILCSCGAQRHWPALPPALDGGMDGTDREEYEALDRLEEHPLDLMTAGPGELRSLPGFPEHLLERVIEERQRHGTARRLFDALTPPEREALRRYESYLELPGRLPMRFEARYTADRLGPGEERRDDLRLSWRSERFRTNARYRSEDIHRLYIAGTLLSGHIRLHGGDLVPDMAMGLCFSSYTASYPFSSGYHIRSRRGVTSATSLYGPSMRGGAMEAWAGPARLLITGGRVCSYANGFIATESGPSVCGARLAVRRKGFSGGGCVHTIEGDGALPIWSADLAWSGEGIDTGAEIAGDGRVWSGLWALSVRSERTGMSLMIHDLHPGWDHPLGRPFYGTGKGRRGCSIVIDRLLARRIRVYSAFERCDAVDAREEKRRDLLRLECRWSTGSGSVKLSIRRRIERRSILVPVPPAVEQPVDKVTDSILLLQRWRLWSSFHLRVSCRGTVERGLSGYLFCPSLVMDRGFLMSLSWAVHRAIEGTPSIYYYERSLKGRYPWRALRGDGWRVALLVEAPIGPLQLALSFGAQKGDLYEAATQAVLTF